MVTGGSGFVGRHLTDSLAAAYPATILLTPAIDVCNRAQVEAAFGTSPPDVCIHLAAVSAVRAAQEDEDYAWQVNLHGTLNLAGAILRHAPECQMLFPSSADAYGRSFRAGTKLDEDAALAPMNIYGATKAAADLTLGSMAEQGLRVARLRPFNHTGPGQSEQFVVAAFARQIARIEAGLQRPVLEVGNLDTWRDFLDVRDVCAAYVACIAQRDALPAGTVLNLASGEARRIGDVLAELASLAGVDVEVRVDPSRVRDTDLRVACGNAERARELLGWAPTIPWARTLRDVLDDWRGQVGAEAGDP
jgi:GDP-4-dehydro-6-deoxy-D-mannose reductase